MGNCLAEDWAAHFPKRLCPSDGCRPAVLISEFGSRTIKPPFTTPVARLPGTGGRSSLSAGERTRFRSTKPEPCSRNARGCAVNFCIRRGVRRGPYPLWIWNRFTTKARAKRPGKRSISNAWFRLRRDRRCRFAPASRASRPRRSKSSPLVARATTPG